MTAPDASVSAQTHCACVQATVVGQAWEVGPKERHEARRLMFARHPQMRVWAQLAHKWAFYELDVTHVEVLVRAALARAH